LIGCWWLICSEIKVLLADKPTNITEVDSVLALRV
jgi:hypothetical protein